MEKELLIKTLRYCAEHEGCDYYIAKDCPREDTWVCGADCEQILMHDAADALEAANKQIDELEADKKTLINVVKDKSDFHATKDAMKIAELEAQLPKEGEWIEDDTTYCGADRANYKCSLCGKIGGTWKRGLTQDELPNYCPNCGARMQTVTDCHASGEGER